MNIQVFCSNAKTLMEFIPEQDRVHNPDVKVLGVRWDSQNDDTLRLLPPKKMAKPTNFDKANRLASNRIGVRPIGVLSADTASREVLPPKLWQHKYEWDDPIPASPIEEWDMHREGLIGISNIGYLAASERRAYLSRWLFIRMPPFARTLLQCTCGLSKAMGPGSST